MPIFGIIYQYAIAPDSIKASKRPNNGTLATLGLPKE